MFGRSAPSLPVCQLNSSTSKPWLFHRTLAACLVCKAAEKIRRGAHFSIVPLGIAAAVVQASIYDVPGGYRAVMFDRFSGVNDKARSFRRVVGLNG